MWTTARSVCSGGSGVRQGGVCARVGTQCLKLVCCFLSICQAERDSTATGPAGKRGRGCCKRRCKMVAMAPAKTRVATSTFHAPSSVARASVFVRPGIASVFMQSLILRAPGKTYESHPPPKISQAAKDQAPPEICRAAPGTTASHPLQMRLYRRCLARQELTPPTRPQEPTPPWNRHWRPRQSPPP